MFCFRRVQSIVVLNLKHRFVRTVVFSSGNCAISLSYQKFFKWLQVNSARHDFQISKFCCCSFWFEYNNKNLYQLVIHTFLREWGVKRPIPANMHISDQYCLRAVLYCVYRCCLANIETTLGLFYKTHISEIRKILLNCFISQFNFIRHSYLHVLISVLSKDKCYYTILCKNCSIPSKQYRITNTEQH